MRTNNLSRAKAWVAKARKAGHEVVWLGMTLGLVVPSWAVAQDSLDDLIGTDGRLRSPIITIGNFAVWLVIVMGAMVFLKGVWDAKDEWQKGDNERKEWRKPLAQMIIGGGVAGALVLWKAVAGSVSGEDVTNPFSAGG